MHFTGCRTLFSLSAKILETSHACNIENLPLSGLIAIVAASSASLIYWKAFCWFSPVAADSAENCTHPWLSRRAKPGVDAESRQRHTGSKVYHVGTFTLLLLYNFYSVHPGGCMIQRRFGNLVFSQPLISL